MAHLDELIGELKQKDIAEKTFLQCFPKTGLEAIAREAKEDPVLLIGGSKEERDALRDSKLINLDYISMQGVDVVADAEEMPFRKPMFKHAVMYNLLEILYNPKKVFENVHKSLKKGGIFWVGNHLAGYTQGYNLRWAPTRIDIKEFEERGLVFYTDGIDRYGISKEYINHLYKISGFEHVHFVDEKVIDNTRYVLASGSK